MISTTHLPNVPVKLAMREVMDVLNGSEVADRDNLVAQQAVGARVALGIQKPAGLVRFQLFPHLRGYTSQ